MIFWLTVSTNGSRHEYDVNGRIVAFFGSGSGVVDCDWRRNFFKKDMVFHFRSHDSSF